jgi:hypothetical protein
MVAASRRSLEAAFGGGGSEDPHTQRMVAATRRGLKAAFGGSGSEDPRTQ